MISGGLCPGAGYSINPVYQINQTLSLVGRQTPLMLGGPQQVKKEWTTRTFSLKTTLYMDK
jgi:hypothetical protein